MGARVVTPPWYLITAVGSYSSLVTFLLTQGQVNPLPRSFEVLRTGLMSNSEPASSQGFTGIPERQVGAGTAWLWWQSQVWQWGRRRACWQAGQ